jgi:hypothetical protein
MILISHRGNIDGRNPEFENNPDYILNTIKKGYDVEVDVWMKDGGFFLGHNAPVYPVDWSFLTSPALWCHAKTIETLQALISTGAHCFWHSSDDCTLTSKGFIWTYPGKKLYQRSICVMPEKATYDLNEIMNCAGVCSDTVSRYKI